MDTTDPRSSTAPTAEQLAAALETFRAREVIPGVWLGSARDGRVVVIRRPAAPEVTP